MSSKLIKAGKYRGKLMSLPLPCPIQEAKKERRAKKKQEKREKKQGGQQAQAEVDSAEAAAQAEEQELASVASSDATVSLGPEASVISLDASTVCADDVEPAPVVVEEETMMAAPEEEEEVVVPAPTGCLPFKFRLPRLRRKYVHVKLPVEVVQSYIERGGDRCFAYVNLHNALYHYELPGVGLVSYAWLGSVCGKTALVPADPLAASEGDLRKLLKAFHRDVPGMKQYLTVCERTAVALRELGFQVGDHGWLF
jgi:hypothetical protein